MARKLIGQLASANNHLKEFRAQVREQHIAYEFFPMNFSKRSLHYFFAALILSTLALVFVCTAPTLAQTAPIGTKLDANGWTVFTPSVDTRVVYVSNSTGNDANSGRSQITPIKTIAKGVSLLRTGFPDWLLLKKGDTWTDQQFGIFTKHGRSAAEPMLISSYPSSPGARPLIQTVGNGDTTGPAFGAQAAATNASFVALVGLEFYSYKRDPDNPSFDKSVQSIPSAGLTILTPISWFLIEDCKWSFYTGLAIDVSIAAPLRGSNVSFRRNVIYGNYSGGARGHAQGIYIDSVDNLILEENVFDHNGWNATVGSPPDVFNHNIYLADTNGPVIVRGNISARASANAAQFRPGGTIIDNLFVNNPLGFFTATTPSTITLNVVTEGRDIDANTPRAQGIEIHGGAANPTTVTNNIVAHVTSTNPVNQYGIILHDNSSGDTITNNVVCGWGAPLIDNGSGNTTSPNVFRASNCDGLGPDPNRSVGSYNGTLGDTATLTAFLAQARMQSKDNWRPQYTANAVNNYIRAGFGIGSVAPSTTRLPR